MIYKQALEDYLKTNNIPAFRGKQVLHAVYKEGIRDIQDIKVLPKNIKERLKDLSVFSLKMERETVSKQKDTVKALFKLRTERSGTKGFAPANPARDVTEVEATPRFDLVEGVLMRFKNSRNSVCVSSQVGCPLRCAFCATGSLGFKRNLSAEEITDQVLYFDHWLKEKESGANVTHVVFMGMGEPLLNYENVISAVSEMNDPDCLGIGARHITISTAGVIPGIKRLEREDIQVNLAVSLHAPNQKLRESFMPIAKSFKLPDLMETIKSYIQKTHRRVSYEYVMLKDINDSPALAKELASLLRGQLCHVNLIPYNETYLGFTNAGRAKIDEFKEILESFKIPVTVRVSLGQDIAAACGQLAIL